jgi:hypothetical protein
MSSSLLKMMALNTRRGSERIGTNHVGGKDVPLKHSLQNSEVHA